MSMLVGAFELGFLLTDEMSVNFFWFAVTGKQTTALKKDFKG